MLHLRRVRKKERNRVFEDQVGGKCGKNCYRRPGWLARFVSYVTNRTDCRDTEGSVLFSSDQSKSKHLFQRTANSLISRVINFPTFGHETAHCNSEEFQKQIIQGNNSQIDMRTSTILTQYKNRHYTINDIFIVA